MNSLRLVGDERNLTSVELNGEHLHGCVGVRLEWTADADCPSVWLRLLVPEISVETGAIPLTFGDAGASDE